MTTPPKKPTPVFSLQEIRALRQRAEEQSQITQSIRLQISFEALADILELIEQAYREQEKP